jgi:uracil-DNA glycosylase
MSRRRLFLEEMGIAPLWRLRAPPSGGNGSDAAAQAVDTTAELEPGPKPAGRLPTPAAGDRTAVSEPGARENPTAPGSTARPAKARNAPATRPPAEDAEARARRERILQMDWSALEAAVAQCVACPLHRTRTQTVFGVGDRKAEWLFVGEGPGKEEDLQGEPFVGQAGRLLDSMLAAIGLERGRNVYIANVVKCRPPENRTPQEREMSCCEPYLSRQIELIQPRLIVALGKTSANHLLQSDATITSLRGRVHRYRGTPLIATYHPAYLLRSLPEKAKAWIDLCFARETMEAMREATSAGA